MPSTTILCPTLACRKPLDVAYTPGRAPGVLGEEDCGESADVTEAVGCDCPDDPCVDAGAWWDRVRTAVEDADHA